jgi:hypothetical protein
MDAVHRLVGQLEMVEAHSESAKPRCDLEIGKQGVDQLLRTRQEWGMAAG